MIYRVDRIPIERLDIPDAPVKNPVPLIDDATLREWEQWEQS